MNQAGPFRVLVTGSSGAVGRTVVAALEQAGHRVRGFDRVAHGGLTDEVIGDIECADDWERAADGIDTLVHLAATPDDASFVSELLGPNILGVYRALEAAGTQAGSGLRRVVLASTVQVVSGLLRGEHAKPGGEQIGTDESSPRNHYALTKVWAEHAGRMVAEHGGLSVVVARIGWFLRSPAERERLRGHAHGASFYVSHRDAGRFFVVAVEADQPGYGVYWCVGPGAGSEGSRFDLEPGRRVLGYDPRDVFPAGTTFSDDEVDV